MFDQSLNSRGFITALHVALWVLLLLTFNAWRGKSLQYQESEASSASPQCPVPVARLANLWTPSAWAHTSTDTNRPSLFATRYFTPLPPPKPPAPTTRKVAMIYKGFFQTGDLPRHSLVTLDGVAISRPIGAELTTDLFVAELTLQTLTVTNSAGQTNVLNLNTQRVVEVPLR